MAQGTTHNWTNNTVGNINGTNFSDSNPTSSNTNGQLQQYTVTTAGSSAYAVRNVKWTARVALSSSPSVTKLALGVNSGGSVAYGNPSGVSVTGGVGVFNQYEQCDGVNPVTGNPYTLAELNALQGNLEALT